jgi:hypothetical protein
MMQDCGPDSIALGEGSKAAPSDPIKGGELLDQLNGYQLLKENSVV